MPPTCPIERPLEQYLSAVSRGLWAIGSSRRRQVLRTLRADLLDLAEDRGLQEEQAFEAFLKEQPAPGQVARALQKGELDQAYWRILVALLPMVLAGLWTLVSAPSPVKASQMYMVRQVVWFGAMTYLHFALRVAWAHQREPLRLLWGLLLGGAGGFLWFALTLNWSEFLALKPVHQAFSQFAGGYILTGTVLGLLVERVAQRKRGWVLAFDAPICCLLFLGWEATLWPILPGVPAAAVFRTTPSPDLSGKRKEPIRQRPVVPASPTDPTRFIPATVGLQAVLWAGARTSRRLGLLRLFKKGPSAGSGPATA